MSPVPSQSKVIMLYHTTSERSAFFRSFGHSRPSIKVKTSVMPNEVRSLASHALRPNDQFGQSNRRSALRASIDNSCRNNYESPQENRELNRLRQGSGRRNHDRRPIVLELAQGESSDAAHPHRQSRITGEIISHQSSPFPEDFFADVADVSRRSFESSGLAFAGLWQPPMKAPLPERRSR